MSEQDCPTPDILQALVAHALTAEERDRVLAHADGCNACHAVIEALHQTDPAATLPEDDKPRSHRLVSEGTAIGRYRIERPIGIGGMGVVYVAHDPELDRKVAVKVLRRGASDSIERLRREGRALAALTHPNVVAVHDVGDHDDELFIAMEFVDGSNLRGWLSAKRRSWREIVEVALAVGRGLEAAHIAGLVHRDIKPDNILLGSDGRIRVGDFGLVNELPSGRQGGDVELTQTGALLGTPAYMSPEQLDGGEVDARSDQWSYCATVFEALYGVRAFAGKSIDELSLAIEDGELTDTPSRSGVPGWFRRIIVRGLAVEPRKRWPSMRALCDAIERSRRRRRQLAWIVPIGALALASGGAYIATRPTPVDCSDAGVIPWSSWNSAKRAMISANNPGLTGELDRWIADWSSARAEACTINVAADDDRTRRLACLDHQLDRFVALTDGWQTTADPHVLSEVVDLRDIMPSLSRCSQVATAGRPSTPAQQATMEALERVMANAMQVHRGGDLAAMTRIGKQAFAQANASGYAPAIIDVARVYAAYQNSDNDPIGEEATYREGLGAAELAHDDGAKAVFGLRLAAKLANNQHLDEATHFLDLARASATRVPASPLMDAEVAYAEGLVLRARSDFRGSVAALRRFMTLRTSVFGELDRLARFEMPLLANVLDQVDPAQAVEVRTQLDALDAKADPRVSQGLDRKIPKLLDKAVHEMNSGDFEASARTYDALIAIGEHEIGASPRVAEWYRGAGVLAQIGGHLERAYAQFTHAFAIWDEFATRTKDVVATHGYSSRLLCDLGRYPEAVVHARKGLDLALELDDTESAAERRVDLGEGLLGTGDAAAARAPLEQALAWRQDHGAASARGRVKLLLARALWSDTPSDRKRAIDLARNGRSDIAASIALLDPKSPVTRIAKPRQEKMLAAADAWLREHH